MSIKITVSGQRLICLTPYHPSFPSPARDMGGKWLPPAWIFDARDERRIRDLCLDLFGTDGTPCELVTLRVTAAPGVWERVGKDTELYMAGRLVAKVFGRDDQRARLGDGVVITSGRLWVLAKLKKRWSAVKPPLQNTLTFDHENIYQPSLFSPRRSC